MSKKKLDSHVHLVRDARTLCGLDEWGAGNVDIKFGIEHGVTTCLECLRKISLELLSTPSPLEPGVLEVVKDLLYFKAEERMPVDGVDGIESNRRIIEAFRRGRSMGSAFPDEPPEVPEEIKELLWSGRYHTETMMQVGDKVLSSDDRITEAYRRGQRSKNG
jgi:hypothetical protein